MTEIAFHFNMPDKLAYSCRLLRKIHQGGVTAAVTAEPELLDELDALLWSFSGTDFVPHCLATALPSTLAGTPVVLSSSPAGLSGRAVLLNLGQGIPLGFEGFERVIEVVSLSPDDVQAGRSRWKHYAGRGYMLKRHDLASRAPSRAGTA